MCQSLVFLVFLVFLDFQAFFGSEGPGSGFLWFYYGFLFISVKVAVLRWFSLVLCRFLWFYIAFPWFLYGSSSSRKVFFSLTLPFLLKVLILVSFSVVSSGFLWFNVDMSMFLIRYGLKA